MAGGAVDQPVALTARILVLRRYREVAWRYDPRSKTDPDAISWEDEAFFASVKWHRLRYEALLDAAGE